MGGVMSDLTPLLSEMFARRILAQTIVENRCSEFLECMWDGGSATLDATTGQLVLASGAALSDLLDRETP